MVQRGQVLWWRQRGEDPQILSFWRRGVIKRNVCSLTHIALKINILLFRRYPTSDSSLLCSLTYIVVKINIFLLLMSSIFSPGLHSTSLFLVTSSAAWNLSYLQTSSQYENLGFRSDLGQSKKKKMKKPNEEIDQNNWNCIDPNIVDKFTWIFSLHFPIHFFHNLYIA